MATYDVTLTLDKSEIGKTVTAQLLLADADEAAIEVTGFTAMSAAGRYGANLPSDLAAGEYQILYYADDVFRVDDTLTWDGSAIVEGGGEPVTLADASVDAIVEAVERDEGLVKGLDAKVEALPDADATAEAVWTKETRTVTGTQDDAALPANVKYINDIGVGGSGVEGDTWGPAPSESA